MIEQFHRNNNCTDNNTINSTESKIPDLLLTPRDFGVFTDVIISLTSYPARIQYASIVIEAMTRQSVMADRIVIWLALEQFPEREMALPKDLLSMLNDKVEIRWCQDIRSHKKYYYAMKEFPESIIITVDDDLHYANDLVENLLKSYIRFPFAVSALRTHLIQFDQNGAILPYAKWKFNEDRVGFPSYSLFATGCAGILFPPNCMNKELFNTDSIRELCINADDLWLKTMQLISGTPVVLAAIPRSLKYIDGSQENSLWKSNLNEGGNDEQLCKILNKYDTYYGSKDTLTNRVLVSYIYYKSFDRWTNQEADAIRASWSYRIGRAITWLPRKIRGGIRCYKENGLRYTIRHVGEKVRGKLRL